MVRRNRWFVSQTHPLVVKCENQAESSKTMNITDSRIVHLKLPIFFPSLLYITHMHEGEENNLYVFPWRVKMFFFPITQH